MGEKNTSGYDDTQVSKECPVTFRPEDSNLGQSLLCLSFPNWRQQCLNLPYGRSGGRGQRLLWLLLALVGGSLLPGSRAGGRLGVSQLGEDSTASPLTPTHASGKLQLVPGLICPGQVLGMSAPSPAPPKPAQLKAWVQRLIITLSLEAVPPPDLLDQSP